MKTGLYINNEWFSGHGERLISYNPATGDKLWEGPAADSQQVSKAVGAARAAFPQWGASALETRTAFLQAFKSILSAEKNKLSATISMENGKPLWEAKTEVDAMMGKIDLSIQAYAKRCPDVHLESQEREMVMRHRPHGVIAVLGPFNFPGHLPHSHIIPALLAGNTVVFKSSELTPLVSETLFHLWEQVGLPAGVLNLLQGGAETGRLLADNQDLDGIFFTGSWSTGNLLSKLLSDRPGKILALEMGGNNPLIITEGIDPKVSAYLTVQSAYITSGQRCTCARRLIVPYGASGDAFLHELCSMIKAIRVGIYTGQPEPFMGPVISVKAANKLLEVQHEWQKQGAASLIEMQHLDAHSALLSPGLIDVTAITRPDEEHFGPLLQLIRVDNFEKALVEAANTRYGLVAGLISSSQDEFDQMTTRIKAGIYYQNTATTNASSALAFGGTGKSGNFRPSAYYASDYCAYPATYASGKSLEMPNVLFPGIDLKENNQNEKLRS